MKPLSQNLKKTFLQFANSFMSYELWLFLSWQEIALRYRRSVIGPFWITLGMTIFITAIGFIFSRLFKVELEEYLPYLACSYVVWWLIASTLIDSTGVFIKSGTFLKEMKINPIVFIFQSVFKNIFIFLHNFIIIFGIYLIFEINPGIYFFVAILGFIIVFLNLYFISAILALIGARYRDFGPVVQSIVQVSFFVTPITWMPKLLDSESKLLLLNPFTHFLEITRIPLLGQTPQFESWIFCIILLIFLFSLTFIGYSKKINKIVFWV